jgi:hypothetical protein
MHFWIGTYANLSFSFALNTYNNFKKIAKWVREREREMLMMTLNRTYSQ